MRLSKMSDVNISPEIYNAIYDAIEQIFAKTGKKPKYSEIQNLYKTSNSYIQVVLADWIEKNSDALAVTKPAAPQPIALSPETINALSASFLAELERARVTIAAELDDERRGLYEIRDDAITEMEAQMQIADAHYSELLQLTDANDSLTKNLEIVSDQLLTLKSEHDLVVEKNSRLEGELARSRMQNDAIEVQLAETKNALATALTDASSHRMQCDELNQRGERLTAEINTQRDRLAERDKRIEDLSQELLEGKRKTALLEGSAEALGQHNATLEQRLQSVNDELAKLNATYSTLLSEHKFLKMKFDDLNKSRDDFELKG